MGRGFFLEIAVKKCDFKIKINRRVRKCFKSFAAAQRAAIGMTMIKGKNIDKNIEACTTVVTFKRGRQHRKVKCVVIQGLFRSKLRRSRRKGKR